MSVSHLNPVMCAFLKLKFKMCCLIFVLSVDFLCILSLSLCFCVSGFHDAADYAAG